MKERDREGEQVQAVCKQRDACVCGCVSKVTAQNQEVVSVLTLMSVDYPE